MDTFVKRYGPVVGLVGGVLGVIAFFLGLYDRWSSPTVEVVGIVPVDVYLKQDSNIAGDGKISLVDHGLSFVVQVRSGSRRAFIGDLEIKGKVHIPFNDYISDFPDDHPNGSAIDLWEADFTKRGPYRRISWKAWQADNGPIMVEPHAERFVRLTVVDATAGETVPMRPSPPSYFIGFDDGSKQPVLVDDFPEPRNFLVGAMGPTFAQDVNSDVKNGNVQLFLRVGSDSVYIPPSQIQRVRRVLKRDWEKDAPDRIYFGRGGERPPGNVTPYKN
jgi:hypothetical protein